MESSLVGLVLSLLIGCSVIKYSEGAKQIYRSESATETGCANSKPATYFRGDWIARVPAWYVQMGSSYFFHQWIERLTNQSGSAEQIRDLCLKIMFLAPEKLNAPYQVVAGGLGRAATYTCKANAPHTHTCGPVPGSPMAAKSKDEYEDTIVYTDNKHFMLVFRCTHKMYKSWYVMTPSPTDLSPIVKKTALIYALKNGKFDKKYAAMISYDKCPKPSVAPLNGNEIQDKIAKDNEEIKRNNPDAVVAGGGGS